MYRCQAKSELTYYIKYLATSLYTATVLYPASNRSPQIITFVECHLLTMIPSQLTNYIYMCINIVTRGQKTHITQ